MPTWASIVSTHASGREVVTPQQVYPLNEFTLTYELLQEQTANQQVYQPNAPYTELQQIAGLFLACSGQYGRFTFDFPADDSRTGGAIGIGDGVTTVFTVFRTFGPYGFVEPVGQLNVVNAVYFDGVVQVPGTYGTSGNQLVFLAAPSNGVVITADYSFFFLCRFIEDQHDYDQFMFNLWTLKSLKIRSVKA
jgi:hypothetical protein